VSAAGTGPVRVRGARPGDALVVDVLEVVPAADFSFSRSERLRVEVPVGNAVKPGDGRLLDRTGQPLKVPVAVAERVDQESGQRWITADVTLAPLAAGDYAVELTTSSGSDTTHVIAAFRVRR